MSAGVCRKRVGFEEIFGSSSSPTTLSSSAKRIRWSSFGSPSRSEFGSGSDGAVSVLLQMFPALDPELVETILRNHNNNVDDAIESLRTISFGNLDARNRSQNLDSATIGNCAAVPDQGAATCSQVSDQSVEDVKDIGSTVDYTNMVDGSKWVDMFVQEMKNATDVDDAKMRAAKILEAFERSITSHSRASKELEHVSLKHHIQSLLNDNQILKRAVAIQHERSLEQEEKAKEVEQLKQVLSQYQEQIQSLELSNYTLKLHLQRAQESSSIPGQFHRDIF
ncbi:hypothetical protein FEM48_Zijuj11G0126800 [Ziziphus jujuba var. spinosa]|uniref:CUE domain-containing protein n=1 Tax=Ziziphus jujuba var. spinosa TaxID=714518 RepID=A0A978UIZ9_ZIZJJ|nr:hypothetical protein FEM48_Zijuj11G0126800 [Ziziphus jujuba var. spinosa]